MDRNIAKHLAKRGVRPSCPSRKDLSFSERNPDFFKWFEESVMGFDSEEYHKEFWREAYRKGRTIGHVPQTMRNRYRQYNPRMMGGVLFFELALAGSALAVWLIRREIDRHVQRLRRPTYYETERARRLGLAEERRRIRRRRTLNAMPGREELLEAFRKAKDSPANMIRFGSLIEDLECYVDNTPYFKDGQLIGRRGGIRRHLEREIPELHARYKTVMKYKALSRKFRQATGISDPVPSASILPEESNSERCACDENSVRREISGNYGGGMAQGDWRETAEKQKESLTEFARGELGAKQILAKEILEACEGSTVSLAAQLEIRINPDYTPPIRVLGDVSSMRIARGNLDRDELHSASGHCKGKFG
jgi:hypothetical protein